MPCHRTEVSVVDAADGLPARVRTRSSLVACRIVSRGDRAAELALFAGGAMLLGDDRVRLEMQVGDGCRVVLTDVGGTVVYDGAGASASFDVDISVGDGATLVWDALPIIVADGAELTRRLRVELGARARLELRETVVLGRAGERGGRAWMRTEIEDADGPVLVEELGLDGRAERPGVTGASRIVDAVVRIGQAGSAAESAHSPEPRGGTVLRLEHGGTVHRWLGAELHRSPFASWRPAHVASAPPRGSLAAAAQGTAA